MRNGVGVVQFSLKKVDVCERQLFKICHTKVKKFQFFDFKFDKTKNAVDLMDTGESATERGQNVVRKAWKRMWIQTLKVQNVTQEAWIWKLMKKNQNYFQVTKSSSRHF